DAVYSFYGAGEHINGSSFTVSASQNPYYIFENWTDESGEEVSEDISFRYIMPNRHTTLTANFHYDFNPANPDEPGSPSIDDQGIVGKPRMTMLDDTHVMILCSTPGATIHYTLDGTEPTTASTVYTEPVFVPGNIVVKAIAVKEGMTDSSVTTYQVTSYRAAMPVIAFEHGKIRMTSATDGAEIHYTIDNSDPTTDSSLYSGLLELEEDVLIKAIATKADLTDSDIAVYVFSKEEHVMKAPTFKLHEDLSLEIIPAVEGGETRYTTDGTDPVATSTLYTGPVRLGFNCTVRAYTTHIGYYDSPIGVYTVSGFSLPTPTAEYGKRSLTLSCEDADADIRYTVDGSAPTSESTLYEAPIALASDCTVRFIAMRSGFEDSEENSYVFTLADWQEKKPELYKDFRNRRIAVSSPDTVSFRLVASDIDRIVLASDTIDVVPGMSRVSVTALATNEDRYDSETLTEELVFHKSAVLSYDGHSVNFETGEGDSASDSAELWCWFNDNLRQYGSGFNPIDILGFGTVSAVIQSDNAFRSDTTKMQIDAFNTGRMAGVRNGHRLSEVFGTWGDKREDYTYLRVRGEVVAEDLRFIAGLPSLTTLHLDPYTMPGDGCDNVFEGSGIETIFSVGYPEGMLKGMPRLT
ncbi:MAG: chitobiase/beta-hexosaminidase C-terminal domain-containing protein, partial [Muribaculaceae bacterium]|nr:chitobiase/beta-hexosaminidase C-terminal domain-containing protein [Muribaculaceae bacterium]